MTEISLGIIGAGPWGVAVLDRLITRARSDHGLSMQIALFDGAHFGPGMHDPNQPEHLLLNTVTGQIDSFSARHFGVQPLPGALTFLEWVRLTHDPECPAEGFLPRWLFGAYMKFVFNVLKTNLPVNVQLKEHQRTIDHITPRANRQFRLLDGEGGSYDVGHVFVCTGHGVANSSTTELPDGSLAPYPIEALSQRIGSGRSIGIRGLGLTAVDVVSSLTEGRGGRFEEDQNGILNYVPSGAEPTMYCFSRSGTPFSCRPATSLDLSGQYEPLFCRADRLPSDRELHVKADLLPPLIAEMWAAYALRRTALNEGPEAEAALRKKFSLQSPQDAEIKAREVTGMACSDFDPKALLLGAEASVNILHAGADRLIQRLAFDVAEAEKGEAASPFKHAIEMLRVNRDFIRSAVGHGRLTPESRLMFFKRMAPRIAQLIVGPPLSRGREWLALAKAGLLRFDIAFGPEVVRDSWNGHWTARSKGRVVHLDTLVCGHLSDHIQAPGLMQSLTASGLCALSNTLGMKYLLTDSKDQPVDSTGQPVSGITMLGMPTEGSTYFNHYLPSPRSRARVFEQIERAIDDLLCSRDQVTWSAA